jgi:hypothetical protein
MCLVRVVRPGPVEAFAQLERPGWSVATQRGSASGVHDGYTGGRRGRALAGPEVDDDVVFSPDADPTYVELGRHDRARDDTEMAVGSSREFPCVIHVEPYESAANGVGALQRDPHVIKVCGPGVMCHHKHHRWPAAAGSTHPLGCEAGGRHRPPLSAWEPCGPRRSASLSWTGRTTRRPTVAGPGRSLWPERGLGGPPDP